MKRIKVAISLAFLAALIGIWITVSPDSEPRYEGHKLSYWLRFPNDGEGPRAVRALGTNAIPFAIKWMSKDYNKRFASFHRGEFNRGMDVLRYLGEEARPAIPALVELTKNKDVEVRLCTLGFLLWETYPGDDIMRPVLMRLTNDPDPNVRYYAEMPLAEIEGRLDDYLGGRGAESPGAGSGAGTNAATTNQPLSQPK